MLFDGYCAMLEAKVLGDGNENMTNKEYLESIDICEYLIELNRKILKANKKAGIPGYCLMDILDDSLADSCQPYTECRECFELYFEKNHKE